MRIYRPRRIETTRYKFKDEQLERQFEEYSTDEKVNLVCRQAGEFRSWVSTISYALLAFGFLFTAYCVSFSKNLPIFVSPISPSIFSNFALRNPHFAFESLAVSPYPLIFLFDPSPEGQTVLHVLQT